jgi:hypothetical protein
MEEQQHDPIHDKDKPKKKKLTKEERIENTKRALLNRVNSGNIKSLRDRVAYILNSSYEARNSDNELVWSYWSTFEKEKFDGSSLTKETFNNLTPYISLDRARRTIQNTFKLFEASEETKKYREKKQISYREEAIENRPTGLGTYTVFIDETGKNQSFLSVGSLWLLDAKASLIIVHNALERWKIQRNINYEFHFNELSKARVSVYKDFFTEFLSLCPTVGFKLIVINNTGFSETNTPITDLTYLLLVKGVKYENKTGRAPLPRALQVVIDEDEKGADQLKLENIQDRISGQKIDGLYLDIFQTASSKNNPFIQIIDLYTGAINRKLHNPEGEHFKDEFADFILDSLGFDITLIDKENGNPDNSKLFILKQ